MNENHAPSVQFLKRLDINDKSYFFCPQTYVIFSLPPDKAEAFDLALKKNLTSAYDKVKEIIASKAKRINVSGQSPNTESGLNLILTENCNLACAYCWEHEEQGNRNMPVDIALKSVDFLFDYCEMHGLKNMRLNFFGGEPLINWSTIQQTILYSETRIKDTDTQLVFSITTNGTLLKQDMLVFLADHKCEIVISIDGIAEAHDTYRRTLNGKSSHKLVVSAIKKTLEHIHPNLITVLMTVHHENLVHIQESVEFVRRLGIQRIGINPIRESGLPDNSPLIFTSNDYVQLAAFLKNKYLENSDLENNPYSFTIRHRFLNRINLNEQHYIRCGAGRDGFTVGVDGQFYPCSRFAFAKKMALGNVNTGIKKNLVEDYAEACGTVDDSPTCRNCWARYFCGGGCYYESLSRQKDIREPFPGDCLNSKIMIEMALKARIEFAEKYKIQNK